MSDLILPEYLFAPVIEDAPDVSEIEKQDDSIKAAQLPRPSGFKILCAVPSVEETFGDSVIVKGSMLMKAEEQTTTVLFVLRLGPDAYKDTAKFLKNTMYVRYVCMQNQLGQYICIKSRN